MYEYSATVRGWWDADSIYLDIDLGCYTWIHGELCRLSALDAPEKYTPSGRQHWQTMANLIPAGTTITVQTEKDKREKYGRFLVWLFDVNGSTDRSQSWNTWMLDQGLAKPYDGKGPRGGIAGAISRFGRSKPPLKLMPLDKVLDPPYEFKDVAHLPQGKPDYVTQAPTPFGSRKPRPKTIPSWTTNGDLPPGPPRPVRMGP